MAAVVNSPARKATAERMAGTPPIESLDDLTANTFDSDEELDDFHTCTHAERRRDVA